MGEATACVADCAAAMRAAVPVGSERETPITTVSPNVSPDRISIIVPSASWRPVTTGRRSMRPPASRTTAVAPSERSIAAPGTSSVGLLPGATRPSELAVPKSSYLIGVDTGGTYTDAAVIEAAGHKVIASAKALTSPNVSAIRNYSTGKRR